MALILLAVYLEHVQMSEELKAALARIACLEGEIAKRDARIMGLESQYQRDVWGLNNEGDPIGGEPAGGYANDNARLRAELAAIKAQEPVWSASAEIAAFESFDYADRCFRLRREGQRYVYATTEKELELFRAGAKWGASLRPVSETKAQGLVMPERWNVPRPMWKDARQPYGNPLNHADIEAAEKFNLALDEVARLNAAPAAPAADAGIVDMYRHLQKVTPYRFKKIQDASITDGGDVMYFHKDRFDAALLADMAAHCAAKGVV